MVLAVLAAAGCGGGDAPEDTLRAYFDAVEEKDWESACDLLSDRGVKQVWERESGCPSFMEDYLADGVPNATRKAVEEGRYEVQVEGDEATVTPEDTGSWSLVREDGEWRVLQPN